MLGEEVISVIVVESERLEPPLEFPHSFSSCRQFRLQLAEGDPLLREALCEPSQNLLHVGRGARAEQ